MFQFKEWVVCDGYKKLINTANSKYSCICIGKTCLNSHIFYSWVTEWVVRLATSSWKNTWILLNSNHLRLWSSSSTLYHSKKAFEHELKVKQQLNWQLKILISLLTISFAIPPGKIIILKLIQSQAQPSQNISQHSEQHQTDETAL